MKEVQIISQTSRVRTLANAHQRALASDIAKYAASYVPASSSALTCQSRAPVDWYALKHVHVSENTCTSARLTADVAHRHLVATLT